VKTKLGLALIGAVALFAARPARAQNPTPDSIYTARCAICHGANGDGNTEAGKASETPNFRSPDILKMTTAELIATTKDGKGNMPPYAGELTDAQISQVIAYVQLLQKKETPAPQGGTKTP
jgi:mono/diheme cytochrome c family protein